MKIIVTRVFFWVLFFAIVVLGISGFVFKRKALESPDNPDVASYLPCSNCNIILISVDTFRAKNMGLYGYSRNTTPYLDAFASESLVFDNAVTVAPWTLPSHMSLFTGVYPSNHKVVNKYLVKKDGEEYLANLSVVSPELKTLAEILKENGYQTAAFTGGAGVHRQFGFNKGFDVYEDNKDFAGFSDTVPNALVWMKSHQEGKFFVFLHGYDAHGQYVPEGGYDFRFVDFEYKGKLDGSKKEQEDLREDGLTRGKIFLNKEDVTYLTDLYDEKIQRADEKVGQFLEDFKNLGLWDKTIVIVISDHGEELYEHGRIDHGHSLYEEEIRIPLVIRIPGSQKKITVKKQVSNIDVMPTIFEILNIPAGNTGHIMDGTSIFALLKEKSERNLFPETDYRYVRYLRSVRTEDGWKLIKDLESQNSELYNFAQDKEEKKDLVNEMKDKVEQLQGIIFAN